MAVFWFLFCTIGGAGGGWYFDHPIIGFFIGLVIWMLSNFMRGKGSGFGDLFENLGDIGDDFGDGGGFGD